jgi:hypothetical protein
MDTPSKVIIPCVSPGLSCCKHRLVATGYPDDNVVRRAVWCMQWRENRIKDKIFHSCEEHYKMEE